MDRFRGWMPVITGLLVGLGWGLLAALLEGLPLLLQGSPWPHLGERLLAWAYLAAIYGALCALAGGAVGGAAWLGLLLARRRVSRASLAAGVAGLFAAATGAILWGQRFEPRIPGWVVVAVLSAGLGLAVGWLLCRAAEGHAVSWRAWRRGVLAIYLAALAVVLAAAGFHAWLRDLPLFDPAATDQAATVERPNIVLITAGGVRPDHLGIYGYDPAISPNIDALAWRGVRFEAAFATASWGEPSLASLLTSLVPSELGITCRAAITCQPHLDAERLTLAEALQGAGYHTAAFLTSPWLVEELGFDQGFDRFESVRDEEPFDLGPVQAGTLGRLLGCRRGTAPCRLLAQGHARLFDPPIPPGWGGDRANARVARFLDTHGDECFFLWLHYTEALPAYDLEPPFRPLPEGPLASRQRQLKKLGYWELGDPFTARETLLPDDVAGLTALYDAEVHRVDRLVGGVAGLLEAHGLTDRTLVVFAADHGQEFAEHGGFTYGHSLYDEVLRVPLVVAGPGVIGAGRAVETPVSLLDLAPTLADLGGASLPPEAGGQSLVPVLRGEALASRPIFSESLYRVPQELKSLRSHGYKLIYNPDDGRVELYDLAADPAEQHDLSGKLGQVAGEMKSELLAWLARVEQAARDLPRAAPPAEWRDAPW